MAELQQSPESAQNASFLHKEGALKVVKEGTTILTVTSTSNTNPSITVAHGLSFVPSFIAFILFGGIYIQLPYPTLFWNGTNYDTRGMFYASTDATNFTAWALQGGPLTGTYTIKYYLFQETAT